jgi:hypothetical protein
MKAKFPLFKTFYLGILAGCYIAFGTHSPKYSLVSCVPKVFPKRYRALCATLCATRTLSRGR